MATLYPPIREPLTVGARVSRVWALFFQGLADRVGLTSGGSSGGSGGSGGTATTPTDLAAGTLMGRRSTSPGTPEAITVGEGLTMTGAVLSATGRAGGYEPLTTGSVNAPELIFAKGDVISVWMD